MRYFSLFVAMTLAGCVAGNTPSVASDSAVTSQLAAVQQAKDASRLLLEAIASVDGCMGVKSARGHDGTELILAWFENRAAVLRWFEHDYHRKLLRDAGREENHLAAEHFDEDVGPILIIASVAYPAGRGSIHASMFDDPMAGRPNRFAVEYYVPLTGGAFMEQPYAPAAVATKNSGLRDVYDD